MNTNYLKYDASSIQQYLRRRLLESGVYTDQVYPASDLKILIDLFSWTFESIQYILNNNISDVMFKDTNLYENMNRLVKLLSYKPKAYTTATAEFMISCSDSSVNDGDYTIPKFTSISSNVSYSFIEDYHFSVKNGIIISSTNPVLYNGKYTLATCNYSSSSAPYEVFQLENVTSNVDNDTMCVFVENTNESGYQEFNEVKIVDSLIMDASADDLVCEVRLNEDKIFEIKFGDNIHGKILDNGSIVHIVYLLSDGVAGKIEPDAINTTALELSISGASDLDMFINMVYGGSEKFKVNYGKIFSNGYMYSYSTNLFQFKNITSSTDIADYESIDSIREYAPNSFRTGNRLVTASDYRTYILNNFRNRINDVYVCNNNEYCMNFYRWLSKYDKLNENIRLLMYEYAGACDFNNVYLWLQPRSSSTLLDIDKRKILKNCNKIKTITTNIVPLQGIKTSIILYKKPLSDTDTSEIEQLVNNSFEPNTKIVIRKTDTYLSDETIKQNVANIIINYFEDITKFGQTVNISDIYQQIISLGYIDSIRTISTIDNSYINGLSFATYTQSIINYADFETYTQIINANKFQYFTFENKDDISNMIYVENENEFILKNNEI